MGANQELLQMKAKIDFYFHPKEKNPFFSNINLNITNENLNCLIGLSGVGKTTLLRILLGHFYGTCKSSINYIIGEKKIYVEEAKRQGIIGFLPQEASLIPWINIDKNVEIPCMINKQLIRPNKKAKIEMMEHIGLKPNVLKLYPHELSVGMQHRIALARLLLYKPSFILLDEIFTSLDDANANLIEETLRLYIDGNKPLCLAVTHDIKRAVSLSTQILMLSPDRKINFVDRLKSEEDVIKMLEADLAHEALALKEQKVLYERREIK